MSHVSSSLSKVLGLNPAFGKVKSLWEFTVHLGPTRLKRSVSAVLRGRYLVYIKKKVCIRLYSFLLYSCLRVLRDRVRIFSFDSVGILGAVKCLKEVYVL